MKSTFKRFIYSFCILLIQTLILFPFKLFCQDTLHAFPSIQVDKSPICKGEVATLTIQRFVTGGSAEGFGYISTENLTSKYSGCDYLGCEATNVEPIVTGNGVLSTEVTVRKGCNNDPTVFSTIVIKVQPTETTTYRVSWVVKNTIEASPCLGRPDDIVNVTSYDYSIQIGVVQPTPPVLTPNSVTLNQSPYYSGAITATGDTFLTNSRGMRWYTSESGTMQQVVPDYLFYSGNSTSYGINANNPATFEIWAKKIDNGCVSDLSAPAIITILKYPPDTTTTPTPPNPPTTPPTTPVPPNPPPLIVSLIDPNKNALVDYDGSIKTDAPDYTLGDVVTGASTDGLTKVLLVAKSQSPVVFTLNNSKSGALYTLMDQTNPQTSIIATPNSNGQAVAVYNVPDGYGIDNPQLGYTIHFNAQNLDNATAIASLKLVTPPVVLIHGMWSSPAVWSDGNFYYYLHTRGISNLFLVDYSGNPLNATTFDPNSYESLEPRYRVFDKIDEALLYYKNQHIAASQVDVVGHSLGGLMARSVSQQPEFKNANNYYKGFFHKLITIGTPHKGSPLGPELYTNKNKLVSPYIGLDGKWHGGIPLYELMAKQGKPIGTCHRDFAISSLAIAHLKETLPYKTFSITANYQGDANSKTQTFGHSSMSILCQIGFGKSLDEVMKSRCSQIPLDNDLIVPYTSQNGYIDKTQLYYGTAHSFPGINTETSNPVIQQKVADLLISNVSDLFSIGFPAPDNIPLDCSNASELIGTSQQKKKETSNILGGNPTPTGNEYVQISSPVRGNIYRQNIDTSVTLSFQTLGGALPTNALFMIEDVGWYPVPTIPPYTVTITLPRNLQTGNLNVGLLVSDTTGITLGDTSHITILSDGILDSIYADPASIHLDSLAREIRIRLSGEFTSTNNSKVINDISNASNGTLYTTQKNESIISVSDDGVVTAEHVGADTLLISNNGRTLKIPVTVDSNYRFKTIYPNTIAFTDIQDKADSDEPFALDASATSGGMINFTVLSGPIEIVNGIVFIKGAGTVSIKATAQGDAYFGDATPVTKTFYINETSPLQLLTFTSSLINNSVLLNWTTANELNTSYFIVERSTDSIYFTGIDTVNVASSSLGSGNYYFKDQSANILDASPVYYRLREVNKNGVATFSNTISVTINSTKKIIVYPNPAKRLINILLNQTLAGESYIRMYDMTGKVVMSQKLTDLLSQQINLPALSTGNYRIVVWSNGKVVHQQTLFVSM